MGPCLVVPVDWKGVERWPGQKSIGTCHAPPPMRWPPLRIFGVWLTPPSRQSIVARGPAGQPKRPRAPLCATAPIVPDCPAPPVVGWWGSGVDRGVSVQRGDTGEVGGRVESALCQLAAGTRRRRRESDEPQAKNVGRWPLLRYRPEPEPCACCDASVGAKTCLPAHRFRSINRSIGRPGRWFDLGIDRPIDRSPAGPVMLVCSSCKASYVHTMHTGKPWHRRHHRPGPRGKRCPSRCPTRSTKVRAVRQSSRVPAMDALGAWSAAACLPHCLTD